MPNIVPLVHFTDEPDDSTEQESDAGTKSRSDREDWDRREPKRPPNWLKPGAEICERRRDETGGSDDKELTRSHSNNASCGRTRLSWQDVKSNHNDFAPIAKHVMLIGRRGDRLFNFDAGKKKSKRASRRCKMDTK